MNGLTGVVLFAAAVFAAAICGLKLIDMLFGRVPAGALIVAFILGGLAFGAGAVAAIMTSAVIS